MNFQTYAFEALPIPGGAPETRVFGFIPRAYRPTFMRVLKVTLMVFVLTVSIVSLALASDHLDSPATVANPQADIADVYAWISPGGQRLNLIMTILGHSFSNRLEYALHIDSSSSFGSTDASTSIVCRFASASAVDCRLGAMDAAFGDPGSPSGLEGSNHRFRLYAGLRDDPFFNNVKGLLAAYQLAKTAKANGASVDVAGCAHFDEPTAKAILEQMSHTDGGPPQNLLYNWSVSAIVVSVDLSAVSKGGKLLAVWGTTSLPGKALDRMARPFVGNTLLGASPFSIDDVSGARRQEFNESSSTTSASFVPDLQTSLAFQDSLDGQCGNQLLADSRDPASSYLALARIFADDRLWVNSASRVCTQFFAVELAMVAGRKEFGTDCGGRSPTYDTSNVWRSLVIAGATGGISDGLREDEHRASASVFPFLAPPDPHAINH